MPEKVMCIDPGSKKLTLHKIYDLLDCEGVGKESMVYRVVNDAGEKMKYYAFRFVPVDSNSYSVELI